MPKTRADVEDLDAPTPLPSERRIRLETVDYVRVEMARVYRDVRTGKVAPDLGTKLVYILTQIARVTDPAALERRLVALEDELRNIRHEPERIGRTPAQG